MAKKSKGKLLKKSSSKGAVGTEAGVPLDGAWIEVDPELVRFQHSRIRPYFSGCGRSVHETLELIQKGDLTPNDLPAILVIPIENQSYVSLNNRRLWVLKQCRRQGLLEKQNNLIRVRIRYPKSANERERYTFEKCSLEAKFIRETKPNEHYSLKNNDKSQQSDRNGSALNDSISDDEFSAPADHGRPKMVDRNNDHDNDDYQVNETSIKAKDTSVADDQVHTRGKAASVFPLLSVDSDTDNSSI